MKIIFRLALFALLSYGFQIKTEGQSGPLLGTEWSQAYPYNNLAPIICGENNMNCGKSLAGCGAIALAQVLYYYQYPFEIIPPASSYGIIGYNYRRKYENGINYLIIEDLNDTEFIWNCEETTSSEILEIVYIAGISIKSGFDFDVEAGKEISVISNISNMEHALENIFNYNNILKIHKSDQFNTACPDGYFCLDNESFELQIRQELSSNKLVILLAQDENGKGGHFMVIDSFDTSGKFHINFGWGGSCNGYYNLNEINTLEKCGGEDYRFNDNQKALINISPKSQGWLDDICRSAWSNEQGEPLMNYNRYKIQNLDCPILLVPAPNTYGISNKCYFRWTSVDNAKYYQITIKNRIGTITFVDSLNIYGGSTIYLDTLAFPYFDSLEIQINTVDYNGNISNCTPFLFYTDTTDCSLSINNYDLICTSDTTYIVEVDLAGITGHTYDLWAEDTLGVITSLNSITSGIYALGPFNSMVSIAVVAEDELQPFDCYFGIGIDQPRCVFCPAIGLETASIYCVNDSINLNVNLDVDTSTIIDLYTIIEGVNTFNNVGTGNFTFTNIPSGEDFLIIAEDTTKPYDCNRIIYVESIQCQGDSTETNIQTLEYYIDSDPGYGNGSSIPAPSSYNLVINYAINLDTIDHGVHTLYLRAKDENGQWGYTVRKLFYIKEGGNTTNAILTDLEYYIDADPGFGNGLDLPLNGTIQSIETYLLSLDSLQPGVHTLFIRGKDSKDNWSYVSRKLFYIQPELEVSNTLLTDIEFFIDEDPGISNGTPLTLNGDTTSFGSYLLDLDTLQPGVHILHVRAKDTYNKWSYVSRKLFYIRPDFDSTEAVLTDLEYFMDEDPGLGQGNPLTLANDTNSISSYVISLSNLDLGGHAMYLRGKDSKGRWGYTVVDSFEIFRFGPILYVDWNAPGTQKGTSWANAMHQLDSALILATLFDTIQEIWVAEGTYKPDQGNDRARSFIWSDSTKVYGGFIGTETQREQRTSNPSLVILSGDIGMSGDSTDNSYHVVVIDSTCTGCYLDRLTIKLGNANGPATGQDKGAGILSSGKSDVKDIILEYSTAQSTGAAIYHSGSFAEMKLTDFIIRYNNSLNGYDIHSANNAKMEVSGQVEVED